MTAIVDTNILVRHVTDDPPDQARRATRSLESSEEFILTDLVFAEMVYVLESNYGYTRDGVFVDALSVLAMPSLLAPGHELLIRALRLYHASGLDFADAYVAALAEASDVNPVISFDRDFDRIPTIERVEP